MGIANWFKGRRKKAPAAQPLALAHPWRRGTLGEIYCSSVCQNNTGLGMIASRGKSKPCCFCQIEVVYGATGVVYMPWLTEPNLVCARCHQQAQHWNARQKECCLCGKAYDPPAVSGRA